VRPNSNLDTVRHLLLDPNWISPIQRHMKCAHACRISEKLDNPRLSYSTFSRPIFRGWRFQTPYSQSLFMGLNCTKSGDNMGHHIIGSHNVLFQISDILLCLETKGASTATGVGNRGELSHFLLPCKIRFGVGEMSQSVLPA